jgi:hypothetical protein
MARFGNLFVSFWAPPPQQVLAEQAVDAVLAGVLATAGDDWLVRRWRDASKALTRLGTPKALENLRRTLAGHTINSERQADE